jgi:hypothetical protein
VILATPRSEAGSDAVGLLLELNVVCAPISLDLRGKASHSLFLFPTHAWDGAVGTHLAENLARQKSIDVASDFFALWTA